ncbi:MAG: hypothetical protein EOP21_11995 [Hyphomicrobiales bacterium]|nr:MAG: hypothetical protein EOP21_11995 [Hyphomicrobiales bacterium]
MTVRCSEDVIFLEGACPVEDAEQLLVFLQENPGRRVDLSTCTRAHAAVAQVLMAAAPTLCGPEPQGFVQKWIVPNIGREDA